MNINTKGLGATALMLLSIVGLLGQSSGCRSKKPSSSNLPPSGIMRISPSELFKGELKRLEPHIASTNGCVKIEYAGPEKYLRIRCEIWENGNVRHWMGSTQSVNLPIAGELSVTLHDISAYTEGLQYEMRIGGIAGVLRSYLPRLHTTKLLGSPLKLWKPVEVPDDEEVRVWGFGWHEAGTWQTDLPVEELAKKCQWAIVIKVSVVEEM